MATYNFRCTKCDVVHIHSFPIGGRPEHVPCSTCDSTAHYEMAAPNITRASYVDGTKRKGWSDLKEAAKLSKESAHARSDSQKREIATEIKKMGVRVTK